MMINAALCALSLALGVTPFEEGNALLNAWQLEDAKAVAEELLFERPEDPEAQLLSARVLQHQGKHREALNWLMLAENQGLREASFFRPRLEGPAAYENDFEEIESKHFRIHFLNKDEIVAYYAQTVLEKAYTGIGRALDFLPAERGEKIIVEIYPDAKGLAGATGLSVQDIETSGTIAVCKFHRLMIISPLATSGGYGWADTIAHEFVHLVISKKSKNSVPIWLHEGIAKFYETAWRGEPGGSLSPHSEKLLAEAVKEKSLITYDEMHPSMAKLPSQEAAALAFAEVYATIEFLRKDFGAKTVPRLLAALGEGRELNAALKLVYGFKLKGLEKRWKKYLKRRSYRLVPGAKAKQIRLSLDENSASDAAPMEDIKNEKSRKFARLGEMLQLRGHLRAAAIEYEKAYALSGTEYAGLAYRLARTHFDSKDYVKAKKILVEALKVHPENGDCLLLAGRSSWVLGDKEEAKTYFDRMLYINPFNPEIHQLLSKYYQEKGQVDSQKIADRHFSLASQVRGKRKFNYDPPDIGALALKIVPREWKNYIVDGKKYSGPQVVALRVGATLAGEYAGKAYAVELKADDEVLRLPR